MEVQLPFPTLNWGEATVQAVWVDCNIGDLAGDKLIWWSSETVVAREKRDACHHKE